MTRPSGILLAGGRSRRFGRDKVVEPLDGEPLYLRPLRALLETCDDVVIVRAPDSPDLRPPAPAERARVVRDETAFAGPLVGCLTGLRAVRARHALLAAADMPSLGAPVLRLLAERADAHGAVVLRDEDGARPLPAALEVARAREHAEALVRSGERRLRALIDALAPLVVAEAEWRLADPAGGWRRDVDVPADLGRNGDGR